jgi:hypothetical protein
VTSARICIPAAAAMIAAAAGRAFAFDFSISAQ